jgi:uncharacterized protein DUF6542
VSHPSAPEGRGWPASGDVRGYGAADRTADDGWGPSTAVYGGSANRVGRAFTPAAEDSDGWSPAGPVPAREQRATRAAERRMERPVESLAPARARERGLPWWGALALLIVIAGAGGVIDTLGSISVKGGFNVGIVVASVVAVLAVKRSHMFPIVIAPPIVYSAAALFQLYVRSSGLDDRKVVLDAAANYLVYGFPAIASATAAVLIIAGIRLIARK